MFVLCGRKGIVWRFALVRTISGKYKYKYGTGVSINAPVVRHPFLLFLPSLCLPSLCLVILGHISLAKPYQLCV